MAVQFLGKKAFPETVRVSLGDSPDYVLIRGGSAIISPFDLNDIGRGKFDIDVACHYSRPDLFQLIVNEEPQQAVSRRRSAG